MGITGLIPFLEKSSRQVNISQYSGCTVAIDAYCWLHKGAFSCADKLARGEKTDLYVHYCMKYVNMLLSHNIKPILVFDGRHLPAKAGTEKKRRQNREMNKRRAAELLRQDKPNEARSFLQRCVDVTHTMAVELMRECRSRNVDCITAPYEADAQLAYLNIQNIAHIVITEDSDLLLFGCTKVIFKLDLGGNGLLVEQEKLHLAMGVNKNSFSLDKFRYMCILSGCDYLPSLPKIGLAKACRFIKSTVDPDIHRALSRLGGHLNMNIVVPLEYRDKFVEADAMFRYQPVFDPLTRRLVPLTPPPSGDPTPSLLSQEPLNKEQLLDLALGNLDPFTLDRVDDWSPHNVQKNGEKTNSWNVKLKPPHKSVWSSDFKPKALVIAEPDPFKIKRLSTSGKVLEQKVEIPNLSNKRPLPSAEEEIDALRLQFGSPAQQQLSKKPCLDSDDVLELLEKTDQTPPKSENSKSELLESPKKVQSNPFLKTTPSSGNKFSGLSKLAQFKRTTLSDTKIVHSRYFGNSQKVVKVDNNKPDKDTLKDVSNVMEDQMTTTVKSSPVKKVEKLNDSNINSLIDDSSLTDGEKDKKDCLDGSNEKENITGSTNQPKRGSTFRWKPSLTEMFGFKNKTLTSSAAVKNDFNHSSKETNILHKNCSEELSPKVDQISVKRNPFAKTAKMHIESSNELGSQGSSLNDSSPETLTPEVSLSEETLISTASLVPNLTPKPQMKIGLSKTKKSSSDTCQKSLLTMFAFIPKAKLQR